MTIPHRTNPGCRVQGSGVGALASSPEPLTQNVFQTARERLLAELSDELRALDDAGLRRSLTSVDAIDGPLVRIGGKELVCWCSNDYLGLSTHPALASAAAKAAAEWGVGARASRLLAGTTSWHTRLEASLAAWLGAEAAIVFPTGYMTNLGTLGALLSSGDTVFVDRLAHASLLDAARQARATFKVFRHTDPAHLAQLLARAKSTRRRLIVTEGVFSMDGDLAPLSDLAEVAEAHEAIMYVDDAHGAFVLGERGRGTPEAFGVPHERFIYMGTLGKAVGCQGGFVVGPTTLIDFLRNRARTFLYATALAVPVAAAAVAALRLLHDEPTRRQRLRDRLARLQAKLAQLQGSPKTISSPIVPLVVGHATRALELARRLWERGHWVPAIRPPTVPKGTARLRLGVTALHTDAQIDSLARALRSALAE